VAAGTIDEDSEGLPHRRSAAIIAAGVLAVAHDIEQFLARHGRLAAVVRQPEAALACAAAGVDAIYAGDLPVSETLDLRGVPDWKQRLRDVLLDGAE